MNILLSDLPKNKNEIIDDSISHCMHLVDIDYLRPNENDKPDVNINPFNYTIKESETGNSGKLVGHLYSLLFLEYPEYSGPVSSHDSSVELSYEYLNTKLIDINYEFVNIPQYNTAYNFVKLDENASIKETIEIIQENVSKIQKMGIKYSFKWVGYTKMYKNILEKIIENINLYDVEKNNIQILIKDLNVLLLIVESDNKHRDFVKNNALILKDKEKLSLVQKINNIEINLDESDNGLWIKQYTNNKKVTTNGKNIIIKGEDGYDMLDLYSKLSTHNNKRILLNMQQKDEISELEDTYSYVIDTQCSDYAFVCSKLYGHVDRCTENMEKEINDILNFSKKMNLPISLLIQDREVSLN